MAGVGQKKGYRHSIEAKKKMSLSHIGKAPGNKGKHPSGETRKKMSEAKKGKPSVMLGKKHSEETKMMISEKSKLQWSNPEFRDRMRKVKLANPTRYWLGKKRPSPNEETKNKMRETHLRIGTKPPVRCGEKNNKWKGGISRGYKTGYYSTEYKKWRRDVFVRDEFTCQECKRNGGYLTAHHIKSFAKFPDLRFEINNGVTLCEECHSKTDNYRGRNNTKGRVNKC